MAEGGELSLQEINFLSQRPLYAISVVFGGNDFQAESVVIGAIEVSVNTVRPGCPF
jgi:hypothetical protein